MILPFNFLQENSSYYVNLIRLRVEIFEIRFENPGFSRGS